MSQSQITELCDTEKDTKGSRIDDIIQYSNSVMT